LFIASPYFYDINYNPEVFYRWAIPHQEDDWLDLGFYEHESNGKGGELERSWDRVYLRFHSRTTLGERSKLVWDIKAWAPIHYHVLSQDLAEYRGLWELNLTLADFLGPFFERGDLTLRVYPGGQSNLNPLHGGQELTLRTKSVPRAFLPMVVLQLFHGYGESLLDYQMSRWGVRAGLGF
jgi:phospholipase A1